MQHVACFKLIVGAAYNMGARQIRAGVDQRHHILQLVAEAIGPARLIERRTTPGTASQRLIEQPAVE